MTVKLDGFLLRDHLFDPDNMRMMATRVLDLLSQLRGNLLSIRRPSAKHDLGLSRQVANCIHEMSDPFLSSDAADK